MKFSGGAAPKEETEETGEKDGGFTACYSLGAGARFTDPS